MSSDFKYCVDSLFCTTELSERLSKTPEGFLVCEEVPITTAGDMLYKSSEIGMPSNGSSDYVKARKSIESIHNKETIASFEGKPVTLNHPEDMNGKGQFVTPENARNYSRGVVRNVRPGIGKLFDKLVADLVVMDKEAIEAIESKKVRQISCGYKFKTINVLDDSLEQTDLIGNHVAIVVKGRAGEQCSIFDSKKEEKSMSLKDKLKDALSVFSKTVDDAVSVESSVKANDSSAETESKVIDSLSERLSKLDDVVSKLTGVIEKMAADSSKEDEVKEEIKEDSEEKKKEDEAKEEPKEEAKADLDTVSKAEILVPGIDKAEPNLKERALDGLKQTKEGREMIDGILSGQAFDSADKNLLFSAASSMVSVQRAAKLSKIGAFDSSKQSTVCSVKEFNAKYKNNTNQQYVLQK